MNENKGNSLEELERIMQKQYPEATVQYAEDGEHIVIRIPGENGKGTRDIYIPKEGEIPTKGEQGVEFISPKEWVKKFLNKNGKEGGANLEGEGRRMQ